MKTSYRTPLQLRGPLATVKSSEVVATPLNPRTERTRGTQELPKLCTVNPAYLHKGCEVGSHPTAYAQFITTL